MEWFASPWFNNAALFTLTLAVSLLLTPLWARLASRLGIVAAPVGGRHIHARPTPLGGGVALFLAFHLPVGAFIYFGGIEVGKNAEGAYPGFFAASLLLLALGLWDDARNLRPLVKLAGQAAAAALAFGFAGIRVSLLGPMAWMPLWLDCAVTVFWITLVVNAFNLIDGMDGVAAGLALIISLGTAGAQFFLGNAVGAIPYLALAGGCVGFLRYNFNPASVFLGDTGSMFIGFSLAVFPLVTGTHREFLPSVTIPLLMMGIPFFDTVVAVWRRGVRALLAHHLGLKDSGGVMVGDKEHVHHRILAHFANQRKAAFFLYAVNVLLALAALSLIALRTRGVGLFLVMFLLVTALVVRHLNAVELWDTGRLVLNHTTSRQWHKFRVPIYLAADIAAMVAVWFAVRALLSLPINGASFRSGILVFALPLLAMLVLFRVYDRIWTRARPHEFATIPCATLLAGVATVAVVHALNICHVGFYAEAVVFCMAVSWPLLGFRLFSYILRDYLGMLYDRRRNAGGACAVVFGCGGRFALYLHEQNRQPEEKRRAIVGLLDDDPLLKGRLIAGFRVFGPLESLPLLVGKTGAGEIVVTAKTTPERRADILSIAAKTNCTVVFFNVEEQIEN